MEKVNSQHEHEEISLVDVAAIACRQWKVAASVFLILMVVVVTLALMMERKYAYSSVYKVAEQQESDNNPLGTLERPSTVAEKVRSLYTGGAARTLLQEWEMERLKFGVEVSNPDNTLLVVLTSNAAEDEAGKVNELHKRSLEQALEEQEASLQRRQQSLERRRLSLQERLEALSEEAASSELAAVYAEQIADIDAQLTNLTDGEVVQLAERSVEPVGLGRLWVLLLGIIVSLILALVSAWLMHFLGLVSNALRGENRVS